MNYRRFGRTNWQVSDIGYGMWGMGGWSGSDDAESLAALQRARDQAAQSLDDLSQMQEMRQGSSGRPMMMGSGSPGTGTGTGRDTRRSRRSGGRSGLDVRNFVIPGRQDHEVPKLFREELMKSLQDGYPAQYEERIKDYYQRIVE